VRIQDETSIGLLEECLNITTIFLGLTSMLIEGASVILSYGAKLLQTFSPYAVMITIYTQDASFWVANSTHVKQPGQAGWLARTGVKNVIICVSKAYNTLNSWAEAAVGLDVVIPLWSKLQ
jgi:hypothetical protein